LIFIIPVYLAAFVQPLVASIQANGFNVLKITDSSGVGGSLVIVVIGIIIYFVMRAVNNSRGINTKMMFQELPPD
jgi:hypothetical protein